MRTPAVTVRAITPGDWLELQWLASPARLPRSITPGLLAERDGVPIAAIALSSGAVAADPGDPPADAIELLKLLRDRVVRQGGHPDAARSHLHRADHSPLRSTSSAPAAWRLRAARGAELVQEEQ